MKIPQLTLRDLFWLVLVAGFANAGAGDEADFASMTDEELLAALVSKNRMPDIGTPGRESFSKPPANYDRKAQDRVYSAWNELLRRDESVLPALIKGFEDERYSVTENTGPGWHNLEVGSVCRRILAAKLDARKRFSRQPGFPSYVYDVVAEAPERWLEEHRDQTFAELQIESYTWFLEQDLSEFITKASKERVQGLVKKALSELEESAEPYQPPPHKPMQRF